LNLRELARRTGRFPQLVDSRSCVNGLLSTGSPRFVDRQVGVLAPQGVDPDLIRLALVVAALQRERHVLAADGRMNADIDLPRLSGQPVGEHLRFDDTDPGRGERPLD